MRFRNDVTGLSMTPTDEEKFNFEIAFLRERVKNLELIVQELLRGRIAEGFVEGWVANCQTPGFTPMLASAQGHGERIAKLLDRHQYEWTPRPPVD